MPEVRFVARLASGERISYSLKQRGKRPYWFARWRWHGQQYEKTTKERSKRAAVDAAVHVIAEECGFRLAGTAAPPAEASAAESVVTWDEAVARTKAAMKAANLRERTIETYQTKLIPFREWVCVAGPAAVTPELAADYAEFRAGKVKPTTLGPELVHLSSLYRKWWGKRLRIVKSNPFADVPVPKVDRPKNRIIGGDEQSEFFAWLSDRFDGWRLPVLFLTVKSRIGCRISELAEAKTAALKDGRIRFVAETTKGRRERSLLLPQDLFDELRSVAGPTYVWERFPADLKAVYRSKGRACAATSFRPYNLKQWIERQTQAYREAAGHVPYFKPHNFRGTAMTRACRENISVDDASIAFGCSPQTMRKHYLDFDEQATADRVMAAI